MKKYTLQEKALLVSGNGAWKTHGDGEHIRELCLTDGPYGIRKLKNLDLPGTKENTEPATCYPTTVTVASSWDRSLINELGRHLGSEAAEHNVDVVLGPGINIKRSPLCGRNFEYYSEDPVLTGILATEMVKGIQECGVGATVKHFAVNSQEYARQVVSAFIDERTLCEIYLKAFEIVVKNGCPFCIMCSYNAVNGTFMSENKDLLDGILRREFGFDGVIMSDWLAVNDRVQGIRAGLDLEMPESKFNTARLIESVRNGDLDENALTQCAERVCHLNQKCHPQKVQLSDSHELFAKKALDHSAVLMKNNGILPLADQDEVLIIGAMAESPRYQGGGCAHVRVNGVKNFLEKLSEEKIPYQYVPGYAMKGNGKSPRLVEEAVRAAQTHRKILVFLGLPEHYEREGFDRINLDLPEGQLMLMEQLKPFGDRCAVVLSCGSAVCLPFAEEVNALLNMQLGGQAFSDSTFDILYGRVNPSGRLTETYPKHMEDYPVNASFGLDHRYAVYTEGPFVGYRYYDKVGLQTAFPFGFGLSYTNFSYGKMEYRVSEDKITFEVDIKNTGSIDGEEVVQIYSSLPDSAVTRAVKELAGFTKPLIQKGETVTAKIDVHFSDLAIYDTTLKRKIVEKGNYVFSLAKDAETILQTVTVPIDGEKPEMGKIDFYEQMGKGRIISEEQYDSLLPHAVREKKEEIKSCKKLHDNSSISDYIRHFPYCILSPRIRRMKRKHQLIEEPIRRIRKMQSSK